MYKNIVDVLLLISMFVSSLNTLALVKKPWSLLHSEWSVNPGVWRSTGEYGGGGCQASSAPQMTVGATGHHPHCCPTSCQWPILSFCLTGTLDPIPHGCVHTSLEIWGFPERLCKDPLPLFINFSLWGLQIIMGAHLSPSSTTVSQVPIY